MIARSAGYKNSLLGGIVFSFIAGLSVLIAGWLFINLSKHYWPINTVQVIGPLKLVSKQDIQNSLFKLNITEQGFFHIDMQEVKDSLDTNPWMQNIDITKVWPDTLRIKFDEDRPLAYLKNQGIITQRDCKLVKVNDSLKDSLLKNDNRSENYPKNLPILVGNEKKTKKLCDTLEKLRISVKPIDVGIKKLVISQRNALYIELDNRLIVLFGKQDLNKRINRFVKVYNKIKEDYVVKSKDANMSYIYIDMRYHNGLAVGTSTEDNIFEIMETA